MSAAALVAVLAGGLTALGGGAQVAPAAAQQEADAVRADAGATPSGRDAAKVAAASEPATGKPVAPFEIETALDGPVAIGSPVTVRISVGAAVPLESIEVRLTPDAGLAVGAADLELRAASAAPDAPAEWQVAVVPVEAGTQRLRLYAEAIVNGARQGRSEIVTLRVGASVEAAAAKDDETVQSAEPKSDQGRVRQEPGDASAAEDPPVVRLPAAADPP